MSIISKNRITSAAAWVGADFVSDHSWIIELSEEAISALDSALAALEANGLVFPSFTQADFPLGPLEADLARIADELENDRGFCVLRGLPVERYTDSQINTMYFGLGMHLGQPVGQNPRGERIGTVMAVGDAGKKETRVYETNLFLPYHCDPSDVVGLLSVRKAAHGGLSSLVSVAAIYNEILDNHPEFLGLFYRPWYFSHLCEDQPSLSPIFSFHDGKLSCRYLRQYIELGHETMNQPLSRVEIDALDLFDHVISMSHLRIDMMLEPGDLQFANNYVVLHSRNAFTDHESPDEMRKLLRLWLKMPNARTLAPEFPGRNGFPIPAAAS